MKCFTRSQRRPSHCRTLALEVAVHPFFGKLTCVGVLRPRSTTVAQVVDFDQGQVSVLDNLLQCRFPTRLPGRRGVGAAAWCAVIGSRTPPPVTPLVMPNTQIS